LVHAGERITVDGCLIDGGTDVDRALVTGESAPVRVQAGDRVEAGCINLSCAIRVRVERPCGQRFIDRIGIRMLELFGAKSMVAMQSERFARFLIPGALALSILVFLYAWSKDGDLAAAALRALSVLVAACPCAVGLALPLAYAAAAASAARQGILFRDPASMEALARSRSILFDKTGTLTKGRLEVVDVFAPECGGAAALRWAALAETGIAHPVATAIREAAQTGPPAAGPLAGKAVRGGQGTRWESADGQHTVLVGSHSWLAGNGVDVPQGLQPGAGIRSGTGVHVALDGRWIATLHLHDSVREDAAVALDRMRQAGIETRLVTGDAAAAAALVAASVGLPAERVHAGCLPEEKVAVLDDVPRPAVFVGDGINDALALAAADCGIAVQGASTAAVATAGVVIADGGLDSVVAAWRHARMTFSVVRQNLLFSMIYNVAVLSLAASGIVPPVAAAGAMLASSASVIANAARLTRFRG
ncbi:MAG: heavy metal translocating P-type ATPase, partial [Noviherbaspirillum sp.]